MSELLNYSIETDYSVWLSFRDGRNVRVAFIQLPHYLAPRDLIKVKRAMKLRQDFLRHNMPPTLAVLVAAGLALIVVTGGGAIAMITQLRRPAPLPAVHSEMVRYAEPHGPLHSTVANVVGATPGVIIRRNGTKLNPLPTIKPVDTKLSAPAVIITPIAVPDIAAPKPLPIVSPPPIPAPLPTPPAGDVLGTPITPSSSLLLLSK